MLQGFTYVTVRRKSKIHRVVISASSKCAGPGIKYPKRFYACRRIGPNIERSIRHSPRKLRISLGLFLVFEMFDEKFP
jgi:hypothetical protein